LTPGFAIGYCPILNSIKGGIVMLNQRHIKSLCLVIAVLSASWCAVQNAEAAEAFTLTSSAFKDGTPLQKKNAGDRKDNPNCVGENVSPQFAWSNLPAGPKSFALIMVDPEGERRTRGNSLGCVRYSRVGIGLR
jgi:hypothetical protein